MIELLFCILVMFLVLDEPILLVLAVLFYYSNYEIAAIVFFILWLIDEFDV